MPVGTAMLLVGTAMLLASLSGMLSPRTQAKILSPRTQAKEGFVYLPACPHIRIGSDFHSNVRLDFAAKRNVSGAI